MVVGQFEMVVGQFSVSPSTGSNRNHHPQADFSIPTRMSPIWITSVLPTNHRVGPWWDHERYGDSTYSYCYSCRSAIGRHRENCTYGGYARFLAFFFLGGAARHRECFPLRGEREYPFDKASA